MRHLADAHVTLITSPDPKNVYCYSPGLVKLASGRLIATMDFGGRGVKGMAGSVKRKTFAESYNVGKIFLSDDGGQTWRMVRDDVPMMCMRPFVAGSALYIIGFNRDMGILRSDDEGETWGPVCDLSHNEFWHQAPCNVWYKDEHVYLVMERMTHENNHWPVGGIAPVLMRAHCHEDLTERSAWTFASELVFDQHIDEAQISEFGLPLTSHEPEKHMTRHPSGWLETNVVQLKKENDWFYDPTGRTFHLFMRGWTGLPWTGALAKVVERDDGSMETLFETAPSGKRMVFINIPGGGHSKFHMLYDEQTRTYWLLTNQCVDSMVDVRQMTHDQRSGYDRSRLVLYYSFNCFDWLYAGVVAAGHSLREARSYASMVFDGDDLLILSRSGDANALSGHDTNKITFHRVMQYRLLIDDDLNPTSK